MIDGRDVYTYPNIPLAKLKGAISGYKVDINPGEVVFLFDATIFGSADEGLILTWDTVYSKKDNEFTKIISLNVHHDFLCQKKLLMGYKIIVDGKLHAEFKSVKIPMIVEGLNRYMKMLDDGQVKMLTNFMENTALAKCTKEQSILKSTNESDNVNQCQCPKCGCRYPASIKFCSECGSKLIPVEC